MERIERGREREGGSDRTREKRKRETEGKRDERIVEWVGEYIHHHTTALV